MTTQSSTFKTLFHEQLISLQNYILIKKNYVMALHRKIAFSRIGSATKTEVEKNELDIELYESLNKIAITNRVIIQAELDFKTQFDEFLYDVNEMNEYYEAFIELAKKHQSDSVVIKHLLYNTNWKNVNENIDKKIRLYHELKEALAGFLNEHKE